MVTTFRVRHATATLTSVFTLFTLSALVALPAAAASPDRASPDRASPDRARKLLDRVDDLWRGRTSQAKLQMHVKTKYYERKLAMKAWSKGKDQSLVRILSPRREKGMATLKNGKQIYTWLPRTARVIRLSGAMMGSAWMGSHFSNDDLVKESRMAEDYTFKIAFEGKERGTDIIRIDMIPKKNAAVVWGKVTLTVDAKTQLPLRSLYFDEKGKLARTMTWSDVKPFGKRRLPAKMRMTPADKPGEFTEMTYTELKFDVALDNAFFSVSRLKRRR